MSAHIASTLIRRHNQPRDRVQITFAKKGRTKQSFKDECDINQIMAKYQKTGALAHVNQHGAEYGFATSDDFATSMRIVTQAQEMFDGLPSTIRTRFANDPAQFLDFVQDANNKDQMVDMGLIDKVTEEDPTKAPNNTPEPTPPEKKTDTITQTE